MPYVYSNNGLTGRWVDPGENYQPQAGEVILDPVVLGHDVGPSDLAAVFPGYTVAAAAEADSAAAALALSDKIAQGIAITCAATPALNATYALDDQTLNEIGSVARDSGAGLGLPGGLGTFTYPDIDGSQHTFTAGELQALYKAMRNLLLALNTQAAIQASGGTPTWPTQAAAI